MATLSHSQGGAIVERLNKAMPSQKLQKAPEFHKYLN